jgi:hypothetical protein
MSSASDIVMCIICQGTKLDVHLQATPSGTKSILEATLTRQEFHDHTNSDAMKRLTSLVACLLISFNNVNQ